MEVYWDKDDLLEMLQKFDREDLIQLFESRCPQCEGYGSYYSISLSKHIEYCSLCGSEPGYREPSEFTKVLIEILRKHGAV